MATLKGGKVYNFKIFGFSFLIWRKPKVVINGKRLPGGVGPSGSCKLVKHHNHIALAMPNGEVIPHQLDMEVKAPLHDVATATIEVMITLND